MTPIGFLGQKTPPGAITFVGSFSMHAASGASMTLTLPTHQTGDFGLVWARANENAANLTTATSGWTRRRQDQITQPGGQNSTDAIFHKTFASSSETSPVIAVSATAEPRSGSVHVFRGVHATPFDVTEQMSYGKNVTNPTNLAITTSTANACLVLLHGASHDEITAAGAPSTPTGLVLGQSVVSQNHRQQVTAYKLNVGAAATYTPSAWQHTVSGSSGEYVVYTLALRAA